MGMNTVIKQDGLSWRNKIQAHISREEKARENTSS